MHNKNSLLENLSDLYKERIKHFSAESLQIIQASREKALEYARKGIEQIEPENLCKEYIEKVADGMQVLAQIVLEERGKLTNN